MCKTDVPDDESEKKHITQLYNKKTYLKHGQMHLRSYFTDSTAFCTVEIIDWKLRLCTPLVFFLDSLFYLSYSPVHFWNVYLATMGIVGEH